MNFFTIAKICLGIGVILIPIAFAAGIIYGPIASLAFFLISLGFNLGYWIFSRI